MTSPSRWVPDSRSAGMMSGVSSSVMMGVVALTMLATVLGTLVSAQAKRVNGMAQSVAETTIMCSQSLRSRGHLRRVASMIATSVSAPSRIRVRATCPGESPSSPSFMKRKLDPHTSESAKKEIAAPGALRAVVMRPRLGIAGA